jgi:hypothetical protein
LISTIQSIVLALIIGFSSSSSSLANEASPNIAQAKKIMMVDFELRDVSPIPNVAEEVKRTTLIDSVIRKTLTSQGYTLIPACDALKKAADQGNSYLYDRPEIAGKLGGECGADYVYMGQTWKPSFLFVFPQVQVVDTRANLTREQLVVVSRVVQLEASTLDENVTEAAAKKLALQIVEKLQSLKN